MVWNAETPQLCDVKKQSDLEGLRGCCSSGEWVVGGVGMGWGGDSVFLLRDMNQHFFLKESLNTCFHYDCSTPQNIASEIGAQLPLK